MLHQNWSLMGLDTLGRFSAIFDKGGNFYDFLFALLHTNTLLKKESSLKGKEFFPLRVDPFQKGGKAYFNRVASLKIVSFPVKFSLSLMILCPTDKLLSLNRSQMIHINHENCNCILIFWSVVYSVIVDLGVVRWCEGVMYLMSPGHPADIGLQLGKACYPCSG